MRVVLGVAEADIFVAEAGKLGKTLRYYFAAEAGALLLALKHEKADKGGLGVRVVEDQVHYRDELVIIKKAEVVFVLRGCSRREDGHVVEDAFLRDGRRAVEVILRVALAKQERFGKVG